LSLKKRAKKIAELLTKADLPHKHIVLSGHHTGAVVALLTSYYLDLKEYDNLECFCFGMPQLVGANFVKYVSKHIKLHVLQAGCDGKLYASGIFTCMLRYDECLTLKYAEETDNILGFYAVLNAGSTLEKVFGCAKQLIENDENESIF